MATRTIYLSDETQARIMAAAHRQGQNATQWIKETIAQRLDADEPAPAASQKAGPAPQFN